MINNFLNATPSISARAGEEAEILLFIFKSITKRNTMHRESNEYVLELESAKTRGSIRLKTNTFAHAMCRSIAGQCAAEASHRNMYHSRFNERIKRHGL